MTPAEPWGARRPSGGLRLLLKCSRQAELREQAPVGEPRKGGDAFALEREHEQPVRARDRRLGVGEVAAQSGLTVGAREHEPEVCAAAGRAVVSDTLGV